MPDPHISATPQAFSPTPWFERHGASLVAALFLGGDAPEDFAVKMLVHNHERMVMKVEFAGQRALLKAFNGGHSGGVLACYREIAVLANLDGTDLIPPLLAFSQSENWIMSGFVDGPELDDVITPDNAVDHARALGAWYARYTDLMDVEAPEISSDWLSYLNQYEAIKRVGLSVAQQDFLRGLPIKKRLIAKTDSFLGNFLVDQEGALMGVDFEKAELKPYGFDLLVTSRILVRGFPHLMVELTGALVEGWGRGTDAISRAQLLEVTRIFSLATAFTLEYEEDGLRRLRLRRYNTRAAVPASRVQETPFMTDATEQQCPEARAHLVTQLSQLADEQPGAHTLSGSGDRVIVATAGRSRVPAPPRDGRATVLRHMQRFVLRAGRDERGLHRLAPTGVHTRFAGAYKYRRDHPALCQDDAPATCQRLLLFSWCGWLLDSEDATLEHLQQLSLPRFAELAVDGARQRRRHAGLGLCRHARRGAKGKGASGRALDRG